MNTSAHSSVRATAEQTLSLIHIYHGVKVKYMHHEVDTFERVELMRDLRKGTIDVIVGINLLREGLDPVSYTHLDVYKRQEWVRPKKRGVRGSGACALSRARCGTAHTALLSAIWRRR